MRCLEADSGAQLHLQRAQQLLSLLSASGEISQEDELIAGEARGHQRCNRRRWAWDGVNHVPLFKRSLDEFVAGIREPRRACIRDEGQIALRKRLQESLEARFFAVLVIADQGSLDAVMTQQLPGATRILRCDQVYLLQNAQGAQRDVFQIADRRRHQIELAHAAIVAKASCTHSYS